MVNYINKAILGVSCSFFIMFSSVVRLCTNLTSEFEWECVLVFAIMFGGE